MLARVYSAAATLALLQEVGGDRDFYLDRMTERMSDRLDQSAERNYFLLSAYQHAGYDQSGEFPDLYQPDGTLRPYQDLAGSSQPSDLLQDLQQARNRAEESWQSRPGRGDIDTGQSYDTERNNIANGSYWRHEPSESGWTDEAAARQRLYGERYVGDGRIGGWFDDGDLAPTFADRVPPDPAVLYRRPGGGW